MSDKAKALATLARLTISYAEENPFAMHPATEREWEHVLEQATENAQDAGATEAEIDRAGDWMTDRASQFLCPANQNRMQP